MSWLQSRASKPVLLVVVFGLPITFLTALPWLRQQPDLTVYILAGLAALGTIGGSLLLAVQQDQKFDEWHRSAARFSSQWGWLTGAGLVALLLAIPPLQNAIVAFAARLSDVSNPDDRLVMMAFILGFMFVVITQTVCTLVLSAGWRFWMSRTPD